MANRRQFTRRIKNEIRAEDCSEIAVDAINRNLTISINGTLRQKTLIQSLVGMSATKLSVHSINKAVEKVPCETSVRYHLSKVDLESLFEIQSKILTYSNDQILVPGKSYHFAIDFTDDPYYGEIIEANKDYVLKSKMKKSTTTFYSYVSLYITTKGQRQTLAVFPVKKGVSKVEYIQYFSKFTSVNFGKSSILSTSDQPNGRRTETNETNLSFFRIPSQTNSRKKSKRNKSSATVLGPR